MPCEDVLSVSNYTYSLCTHKQILLQFHLQVCRWHHQRGLDLKQWQDPKQEGNKKLSNMVLRQRPLPQCQQDERASHLAQALGWCTRTNQHQRCWGGDDRELRVSKFNYHQQPVLVQPQWCHGQESQRNTTGSCSSDDLENLACFQWSLPISTEAP